LQSRGTRSGAGLSALIFSSLVCACSVGSEFDSNPSAWSPTDLAGVADASAGAFEPPIPGCDVEPPFAPDLVASKSQGQSHRASEPCLEGCHEAGGKAQKIFGAAGTIYRAQGSRSFARSGEVNGIGSTTLHVDGCGNFYSVPAALNAGVDRTQPYVQNPALHRMDKSLYRIPHAGSCNQLMCHDFSSRERWGVYF